MVNAFLKWPIGLAAACALAAATSLRAEDSGGATAGADSHWPMLVGAQLTAVDQTQTRLVSPYRGALSLDPDGDRQPTETYGAYLGWAPLDWAQLYLDAEKFNGAGLSNGTGLGGLTNGDVVRRGASSLPKRVYVARGYLRLMWPLAPEVTRVERAQDQLPGGEAVTRLELKAGLFAGNDDFDRNRYAGGTHVQFLNWSLWQNTSWDFAANTRGYTRGFELAYVSPRWSLRYGAFLMPLAANGQELEPSWRRARGENLELALSPQPAGPTLRLLAWRNIARMGDYAEALARAAAVGQVPNIVADDHEGRSKFGFAASVEQPLADEGETGVFARLGWNDGHTESFAFAEVDRHLSVGGQLSGQRWSRADDRAGIAAARLGLSSDHRAYLAAGSSGFLLGDGRLGYGGERVIEAYYRLQLAVASMRVQLSPDFQYVRNPGYNSDRGPVRFWALRLHLEY